MQCFSLSLHVRVQQLREENEAVKAEDGKNACNLTWLKDNENFNFRNGN